MSMADTVRSEWTKLASVRSALWTLAAMVAATAGIAVFVGLTNSLQPDDTVLGGSLTGVTLAQLMAAAWGVLVMSREYASGTIRSTLAATPRRGRVLAAKLVVTLAVTFAAGLVAAVAAARIGAVLLAGEGYAPGRPWPALLGVAACLAVTAGLGLAVGTIVRSTAGAVTAMTGVILLPGLLGPLLGGLRRWVAGASPLAALQKLAQSSDAAAAEAGTLGAWPSIGLVTAATAAALLVAVAVLTRRDT
jgi:ABC-2 type transport system permease protein